jgi:hypothetical protein
VAHAYNPNYSGGRNHEDHDLKPSWANNPQDPILKTLNTKGLWSGSSVQHLPNKHETLNSNHSTAKKNARKTFRSRVVAYRIHFVHFDGIL